MATKNDNSQREKLTAIVICKDGGETLRACLISLNFCDQVIVADDGSTDSSTEIARYYGVKLIRLEPTDSFAKKRNQTLKFVKEGWVLFIDADEKVSPELARAIESKLSATDSDGYFLKRSDFFLGKKLLNGETGSMWLLRLARFQAGEWERHVHETWAVTGRLGRIGKGEILHTPHPNIDSFLDSINRYTTLEIYHRKTKTNRYVTWLQLFLYPPGKFFFNYIFKRGFMDGTPGFIHAYIMSLHSLLVRIKILEYARSH
jgi:glycosyltransferase involved in cell wall biosynthesis